jgi:four helix bundle protein
MENVIKAKSYMFAIRVVRAYQFLTAEQKEFVLSKQMLRSGTAVGALIRESEHAESRADFIHKMSIALKEANETEYWLLLLHDTGYLKKKYMNPLFLIVRN